MINIPLKFTLLCIALAIVGGALAQQQDNLASEADLMTETNSGNEATAQEDSLLQGRTKIDTLKTVDDIGRYTKKTSFKVWYYNPNNLRFYWYGDINVWSYGEAVKKFKDIVRKSEQAKSPAVFVLSDQRYYRRKTAILASAPMKSFGVRALLGWLSSKFEIIPPIQNSDRKWNTILTKTSNGRLKIIHMPNLNVA